MDKSDQSSQLGKPTVPIWFDPNKLGLNPKQAKILEVLIDWLRRQEIQLARCLLSSRGEVADCKGEMRQLVDMLMNQIPPGVSIEVALRILSGIVQHRNKTEEFQIPLPEFAIKIPPIENPFTSGRLSGLSDVRNWRQFVLDEIVSNPECKGEKLYGRIMASAVLWGGLLSKPSLQALYDLLPNCGEHCGMAHGRLTVTWTESGGNYRRWFPDALTSLLLVRLQRSLRQNQKAPPTEVEAIGKPKPEKLLLDYMRGMGHPREQLPANLHDFLDASLLDLEVRIPRVLTEYAAGRITSHSLRPGPWRRLIGELTVPNTGSPDSKEETAIPAAAHANGKNKDSEESGDDQTVGFMDANPDPIWLHALRISLNPQVKTSVGKAKEKVEALKLVNLFLDHPKLSAPAKVFGGFAAYLLDPSSTFHRHSNLTTLRVLVVDLAKRLPGIVGLEDFASFNGDTLQAAYQDVLEDAVSENQRQKLTSRLRAFQRYVEKEYRVERIDEGETFGSAREDLTVDANVILMDEYEEAKNYLLRGERKPNMPPVPEQLLTAARLILILGFRCGLRRMEVLKLQMTDFNEEDPSELLIRPWEQRRLKTPNATRKLPLSALLSLEELGELKKWKRGREEESKDEVSPFLFSIPGMNFTFLPEALVFSLIHDALRHATRDPSIHFHCLRHSFSTFLVCGLMSPANNFAPPWILKHPLTKRWMDQGKLLVEALYGNRFLTRRHLFGVSRLLGHSSPEMSLEHYVHFADQLLALWLEVDTPLFVPKIWIAASGMPNKTVYHYLKIDKNNGNAVSGFWDLSKIIWEKTSREEKRPSKLLSVGGRNTPRIVSQVTHTKDSAPVEEDLPFYNFWLLLYLHSKGWGTTMDLAARFGFSQELVRRIVAVAEHLERQKSDEQSKLYCHAFEKANGTAYLRSCCPRYPREKQDREIVKRWAGPLWQVLNEQPLRWNAVFIDYLYNLRGERRGIRFAPEDEYIDFCLALVLANNVSSVEGKDKAAKFSREKQSDLIRKEFPSFPDKLSGSFGMRYLFVMAGIWLQATGVEKLS